MVKRHSKTYRNIAALLILGGAAGFAGYYLYFRSPVTTGSREIVARQIEADPSTTISSKVTYQFTDEEMAAFKLSSFEQTPDANGPETVASDPGFAIVASNPDIPPASRTAIIMPSPLDSPPSKAHGDMSVPGPFPAPPGSERPSPDAPAPKIEPIGEQTPANQERANEEIPHIDDVGAIQPITTVLTAEDGETEKLADLSSEKDQNPESPAVTNQQAADQTGENVLPEAPASPGGGSSQPATDPRPLKKMNDAQPEKSKTKSLKDAVWVINVLSIQDEKRQWEIFKVLSQYPYRVYTYTAMVKGTEWKRIRIGFFKTKEEAAAVGKKICRKHNLPQPWIVRPGPDEMEKFYLE